MRDGIVVYRSQREKILDEWLMDGGAFYIAGALLIVLAIVGACHLFGGKRR